MSVLSEDQRKRASKVSQLNYGVVKQLKWHAELNEAN